MARIVALCSGGVRSAVAAALYAAGHEVVLFHVDYGQRVAKAQRTALRGLAETVVDTSVISVTLPHVSELDRYPDGPGTGRSELARQSIGTGEGLSTLARRGIWPLIWSTGVQHAARIGADIVCTGLGEPGPDDRDPAKEAGSPAGRGREFLHAYNIMLETAFVRGRAVRFEAPLMDVSDAEALQLAVRHRVPLDRTWSCTQSGRHPCGSCAGCLARMHAFSDANLSDPLADAPGAGKSTPGARPGADNRAAAPARAR